MNALTQPETVISEAEYLAYYAQDIDCKYEYINGEIWAMAGASDEHTIISSNIITLLGRELWHSDCVPVASDKMVKVAQNYYFPDVVVHCAENGEQTVRVLMEVLSQSTRSTDFTIKLNDYKKIPTLQEYLLIEQDFMHITAYRRSQNWVGTTYEQGEIHLESLGITLSVSDIYHRIVFKKNNAQNDDFKEIIFFQAA